MTGMPDPVSAAVDVAELAALLRERRAETGKSLRDVSAETGVPLATLARVESGKLPDLTTFRNIVAWLGISPDRFFPTHRVRNETTPEVIAQVLRSDSSLSESAREQLTSTIQQMYVVLTAKEQPIRVHLRSHRLFTPEAGDLLANILHHMTQRLTHEKDG
jgi:transcriptional regulator with XRE-family HTH domain